MAKKNGKKKAVEKSRLTINMNVPLIERIKNAVYWTPGLTMSKLVSDACGEELAYLEKKNGSEFKTRKEELRPGRPVL